MTVSPSWMESVLCSPLAMRERADRGSPCEPVHMTTILSSGRLSISKGIDDIGIIDVEITELARHTGVGEHGTTGHDDLAAALAGGVADLLQSMDVARERRDEHAARSILDGMQQIGANLGLGLGKAGDRGVGGVGQQQVDALLGKAADGGIVGVTPSMGVWSSLKSPVCITVPWLVRMNTPKAPGWSASSRRSRAKCHPN